MQINKIAFKRSQLTQMINGAKVDAQITIPCICPQCKKLIHVISVLSFQKGDEKFEKKLLH